MGPKKAKLYARKRYKAGSGQGVIAGGGPSTSQAGPSTGERGPSPVSRRDSLGARQLAAALRRCSVTCTRYQRRGLRPRRAALQGLTRQRRRLGLIRQCKLQRLGLPMWVQCVMRCAKLCVLLTRAERCHSSPLLARAQMSSSLQAGLRVARGWTQRLT